VEHRQRVRTQVDSVDKNLPPLSGLEPSSSRSTMTQTKRLKLATNMHLRLRSSCGKAI